MKSLITSQNSRRFYTAISSQISACDRVDAPLSLGPLRQNGAYAVGCRVPTLTKRFNDCERLNLDHEDWLLFRALCVLRSELRRLGAGKIDPEVELAPTNTISERGRCDLLLHSRNRSWFRPASCGIAEIKVVAASLPEAPDAAALLQAAAYSEMVAVHRKCRPWCIAICYLSLSDSALRVFFYRTPAFLRDAAAKVLEN